jgi:hypothetical protein
LAELYWYEAQGIGKKEIKFKLVSLTWLGGRSFTIKSLKTKEKRLNMVNNQKKYIKPKETRITWPRSVVMSPAHVAAEKNTSGAA